MNNKIGFLQKFLVFRWHHYGKIYLEVHPFKDDDDYIEIDNLIEDWCLHCGFSKLKNFPKSLNAKVKDWAKHSPYKPRSKRHGYLTVTIEGKSLYFLGNTDDE